MSQRQISAIIISVVLALLAITGGIFIWRTSQSAPTLLGSLETQLAFKAYVPGQQFAIKPGTAKYDPKQAILTMEVTRTNQPFVVLAEQAYPETLIFDKLISSLNAEREVGTGLGQIAITHPKSDPDKEVAVLKADTTLMFATSNKPLSDDDWRTFVNTLVPVQR